MKSVKQRSSMHTQTKHTHTRIIHTTGDPKKKGEFRAMPSSTVWIDKNKREIVELSGPKELSENEINDIFINYDKNSIKHIHWRGAYPKYQWNLEKLCKLKPESQKQCMSFILDRSFQANQG